MKAMLLREITSLKQNTTPLTFEDMPGPKLGEGEVLIHVARCGVCHTELDEIEGRTRPPHLPMILGHQVVGTVEGLQSLRETPARGQTLESAIDIQHQEMSPRPHGDASDSTIKIGQRVGVAWIASACGHCQYCLSGRENLCPDFKATGRDINGGYAEYMKVRADFVHPIPDSISDS
ncbi:MAG TPA: alcohol dehydrogenase catalytic domain-containing protein, partial [Anaerolineales bacterium]